MHLFIEISKKEGEKLRAIRRKRTVMRKIFPRFVSQPASALRL